MLVDMKTRTLSPSILYAWVLKKGPKKITWIPTVDNTLEDALLMLAIHAIKKPEIIALADQYFNNPKPTWAEFYQDITQEHLQVLYENNRSTQWCCKLIITVFDESQIRSLTKMHYTVEDYLKQERSASYKSEYRDGQIYAMTGASRKHNLVSGNIYRELSLQLKKRPCEAYINDMRVKAVEASSYHYPDVAVVCGTPQFEDTQVDTLLNPTLLIEVLSPSTEAYDRGSKFAHYRKINSLQEYLLVSQEQPSIERYVRRGDVWILSEVTGIEASMTLESIDCIVSLREIYDKVMNDIDDN